ncbi:MAG: beta-lactamase family protein [Blastochloris sp.]|nr:beta-lactamase family protein [Blastochloris sp.]
MELQFQSFLELNLLVDFILLVILSFTVLRSNPTFLIALFLLNLSQYLVWVPNVDTLREKQKLAELHGTPATPPPRPATGLSPLDSSAGIYDQVLEGLGAGPQAASTSMESPSNSWKKNLEQSKKEGPLTLDFGSILAHAGKDNHGLWFVTRLFWLAATLIIFIQRPSIGAEVFAFNIIPVPFLSSIIPYFWFQFNNQGWVKGVDKWAETGEAPPGMVESILVGILLMIVLLVSAIIIVRGFLVHASRNKEQGLYDFLNPDQYELVIEGMRTPFTVNGHFLHAGDFHLDVRKLSYDPATPRIWYLKTGTRIEFVEKNPAPAPDPNTLKRPASVPPALSSVKSPALLEDLLNRQISEALHPGARLYVSIQGKTLINLSVGQASPGIPVREDTRFLWMSAGKPFTALAILQQIERGNLLLDQPVADVLPDFAQRGKDGITLRHLLTHTGGFRLADKVQVHHWPQAIAEVCATPLEPNWTPGEKAGYHVSGSWLILGELIRRVDGRDIPDYLQDELFSSPGLEGSFLGQDPLDDPSTRATMQLTEGNPFLPHPLWADPARLSQWRTGSNLIGTAQALGRFYETLLQGGDPWLCPESVTLMTQRHRQGMFDQTFRHTIDCGLGLILNSAEYGTLSVPYGYGHHASRDTFGHGGNQCSLAFADPRHHLVFVYLTNGMPGETLHQQRMKQVANTVYEELGLASRSNP